MNQLFKSLYKPPFLLAVIILQALTITGMGLLWQNEVNNRNNTVTQVLAETAPDSDEEYKLCLNMPVSDRPTCAKAIGMKLAGQPISNDDKIRNCMKLRPVFYRYCLDELR